MVEEVNNMVEEVNNFDQIYTIKLKYYDTENVENNIYIWEKDDENFEFKIINKKFKPISENYLFIQTMNYLELYKKETSRHNLLINNSEESALDKDLRITTILNKSRSVIEISLDTDNNLFNHISTVISESIKDIEEKIYDLKNEKNEKKIKLK